MISVSSDDEVKLAVAPCGSSEREGDTFSTSIVLFRTTTWCCPLRHCDLPEAQLGNV